MVKYDSVTSTLTFSHELSRADAEPYRATDLTVDLKALPENIRQLVILTAKVSSTHASEGKLRAHKGETQDDDQPSYVGDRLQKLIARYGNAATAPSEVPTGESKEKSLETPK